MKTLLRWKILAALLVVALTSGFIGATLALRWSARQTPVAATEAAAPAGTDTGSLYVRHLKSYLALSEEQAGQVQASLDRARAALDGASDRSLRGAAAARRQMLTEIRAVLTPEQAARFDRLDELRGRAFRAGRGGEEKAGKPAAAAIPKK